MNTDFPRIITLLRKERNISQKQAATDLGVSQALLSHYEKGIRECGLDFLVKTADYYNVSCDYLLGRCAEPMGKAAKEAPAASGEDKDKLTEEQQEIGMPTAPGIVAGEKSKAVEAAAALAVLGYTQQDIAVAMKGVDVENLPLEEIVRQSLKKMVK